MQEQVAIENNCINLKSNMCKMNEVSGEGWAEELLL